MKRFVVFVFVVSLVFLGCGSSGETKSKSEKETGPDKTAPQRTERNPGKTGAQSSSENTSSTIAVVNGTEISRDDYEQRVSRTISMFRQRAGKKSKGIGPQMKNRIRKMTLKQMIDRELMYQESQKHDDTKPSEKEIEEEFQKTKSRFPDEKQFKAALKRQNQTPEDLKSKIKRQLSVEKFKKKYVQKESSEISDEEAKEYYDNNPKEFTRKKDSPQGKKGEVLPYNEKVAGFIKKKLKREKDKSARESYLKELYKKEDTNIEIKDEQLSGVIPTAE